MFFLLVPNSQSKAQLEAAIRKIIRAARNASDIVSAIRADGRFGDDYTINTNGASASVRVFCNDRGIGSIYVTDSLAVRRLCDVSK